MNYRERFNQYALDLKSSFEKTQQIKLGPNKNFNKILSTFHINLKYLDDDNVHSIFGSFEVNIQEFCNNNPQALLAIIDNDQILYFTSSDDIQKIEKSYLISDDKKFYKIKNGQNVEIARIITNEQRERGIFSLCKFNRTTSGWRINSNNTEVLNDMLQIISGSNVILGLIGDISKINEDRIKEIHQYCKASSSPQIVANPFEPSESISNIYLYLDLGGISPLNESVADVVNYAVSLFSKICHKIIVSGFEQQINIQNYIPLQGNPSISGSGNSLLIIEDIELPSRIYISGIDQLETHKKILTIVGFDVNLLHIVTHEYNEDKDTKYVQYIDLPEDCSAHEFRISCPQLSEVGPVLNYTSKFQCLLPNGCKTFAFRENANSALFVVSNPTNFYVFRVDKDSINPTPVHSFAANNLISIVYSVSSGQFFYTCNDGFFCNGEKINDSKSRLAVDDVEDVVAIDNEIFDTTDESHYSTHMPKSPTSITPNPIYVHKVSKDLKVAYYADSGCVKASNGAYWKLFDSDSEIGMFSQNYVCAITKGSLQIKQIPTPITSTSSEEKQNFDENSFVAKYGDANKFICWSKHEKSCSDLVKADDYQNTSSSDARNILIGIQQLLAFRSPLPVVSSQQFMETFYAMPRFMVSLVDQSDPTYSIISVIDMRTVRNSDAVKMLSNKFNVPMMDAEDNSVSVAFGASIYSSAHIAALFTPRDSRSASAALAVSTFFADFTIIWADDFKQLSERLKFTSVVQCEMMGLKIEHLREPSKDLVVIFGEEEDNDKEKEVNRLFSELGLTPHKQSYIGNLPGLHGYMKGTMQGPTAVQIMASLYKII